MITHTHKLHGSAHADWANSKNRRSVGFLFGAAAISWFLKKWSLVSLSTEEAECTEFSEASRETLWLRQILLDIENRRTRPMNHQALPPYMPTTRPQ